MKAFFTLIIACFFFSINCFTQSIGSSYCKLHHSYPLTKATNANFSQKSGDLKTYNYDQIKGHLNIKVNPEVNFISGSLNIVYKPSINDFYAFNTLLHDSLNVDSIKRDGQNLSWSRISSHALQIKLNDTLKNDQLDSLIIYYSGVPETDGLGSYVNDTISDSSKISWSLSQPYGAKNWWPSKNSLNDKWNQFSIKVETPLKFKVASNGLLERIDTLEVNHQFHWITNYPIADYLIAIAVGEYEIYEHKQKLRGDSLLYQHFLYPFDSVSLSQSKEVTPQFMAYFDSLYGAYPFMDEKYGHATFTFGGGMEHQTMSFMGNYGGELISHELAHQWFGNLITCNSWQELWLNEAFAIYSTYLTYEYGIVHDPRYQQVFLNNFRGATFDFPKSSVFIEDTSSAEKFFTRLPYYKGAGLLHMIRWQIGDDAFFQGIRNYVADTNIRFGFANTQKLQHHFEMSSNKDLSEFFRDWYYGKGYPTYHLSWQQIGSNFKMTIDQTQSDPSVYFFNMPIPYRLIGNNWDTTIVVEPKFSGQIFDIKIPHAVDSVSFDPEMWICAKSTIVTSLNDYAIEELLEVHPNPSNGIFIVGVPIQLEGTEYDIFNNNGELVQSGLLESQSIIDLSQFNQGVYFLRSKTQSVQYKLILSK